MARKLVSLISAVSILIVACPCAANGFVAGADFSELAFLDLMLSIGSLSIVGYEHTAGGSR